MNSSIVSSSRPRSVAVGDFNNDHLFDIVVVNSGTNTIGVFLSSGDGVFAKQQTYLTDADSHPCSVAVAHFNDDDYVDIAVTAYATNNITIFLGNGDGTFTDPTQFSTGSSHPLFVTTGDVNNDNATDLIVVNYGTNSIGVHLGYGNGSFQNYTTYFTGYDSDPHSVALGHFNNDNHLDIAVANYGTSNIGILLGYGNGTFASQKTYTTLSKSHPSSIALADFNHDHHLDIVVSNNGSGNVGIFLGNGDGSFEAQKIYPVDSDSHPEYITVNDLNEDNELDVVVVDSVNDRVHILLGDGNGSFAIITTYDGISESSPVSVGVGDINNNNQSDIVVVNYDTNNVLVLMDYWIKSSARPKAYYTGQLRAEVVAVDDFNNDHIPDIVFNSDGEIYIVNGLNDGSFDRSSISTINISVQYVEHIRIGDVNNDDWMDIISANLDDHNVGVLLGRGNGTFGSMMTYSTGINSHPYSVDLGDMNGDGRLDIVCINTYTNNIGILLGNGDGTFAAIMDSAGLSDFTPHSVALGDINNDYRLDIVVGDDQGTVIVLMNYNNRTFTSWTRLRVGRSLYSVVVADFNNDNNLDITATNPLQNNVCVFLGYGNGTFTSQTIYPIDHGAQPYSLIVADLNNDQRSDLTVTAPNTAEVIIFYGSGNGSFTLARRYSTGFGSKPWGIAVAHFGDKKRSEIVVILSGTHEVAVLTEYTAAEFAKEIVYSTGATPQPYSVVAGDFTHDNTSDVVVANSGTGDLHVLVGSGNGTFDREVVYGMGTDSQPRQVITCDIDQDEQLDVVSVDSRLNSVTVMMGQSDGTFAEKTMYSTGNSSHPYAVVSSDLDSNGRLDLVVANEGTDSVSVLYGFNYSTFQNPVIYSSNDSLQPVGIVVSDFNNDGIQDIASAFSASGKIGVYLGHGNGSFILPITYSIGDRAQPYAIAAIDLNNDGLVDIVVSDVGTDSICILLGYSNGSFGRVRKYSSGGSFPISVAIGDMDNDNRLDLVVANYYEGNMIILFGYGDGTFSAIQLFYTAQHFQPVSVILCDLDNDDRLDAHVVYVLSYRTGVINLHNVRVVPGRVISLATASSQPRRATTADFNDDRRLDYAVADYTHEIVNVFLNDGNNTFLPEVAYSTGSGSVPYSLDTSDCNNDGIIDIVVVSLQADGIVILFGVGDGTFLLGRTYSTSIGSGPFGLAIGDFNNDTQSDFVVANFYANNTVVFLGNGNEPFGSVNTYATGDSSRPHSVAVGDVNNDHRMDIVVANYGTDNVGVLLGRSDRKFSSIDTYSTGSGSAPYCVGIADLNKDNYLDIVVTTSETDNLVIFLGNDNGTFVINATYSTGYRSRPYTLVISDFNNDKTWDIAVTNSGTSNIFLIYGNGHGTFGNETSYSLGYGYHPYSIAVTDLNSDGWMDIVVACYDTDHIEAFIQMC